MTIVAPAGQYPEGLQGYGNAPGVRGGFVGTGAKIAVRYGYRGAKWLARRLVKPRKYTYSGAVGRGIGIGTLVSSLLPSPDIDDINGTIPGFPGKAPDSFKQRNNRFNRVHRCRRDNDRHRHCKHC